MLTSSNNFRNSLFAAALTVLALAPTIPAQAVETQVKAKAPITIQAGSTFKSATSNISSSHPALTVASLETVKESGPAKCFSDCVGNSSDFKLWVFCDATCK
jgi:hypothetical protein